MRENLNDLGFGGNFLDTKPKKFMKELISQTSLKQNKKLCFV